MTRLQTLQGAALLFIGTWIIHTADHARRGLTATTEAVVWVGTAVGLLAAVSVTLIFVRHPTAPAIAAAVFPAIALGVTATHLFPGWGVLSDPLLIGSTTDNWSIVAATGEIVAAAILGVLAVRVLMRNDFALQISETRWK